jgi:hypothetical protein
MYKERLELYKKIEELRGSKVLLYVTGDRPIGMETQISSDVIDFFADHLDILFNKKNKISLILYSRGGDTLAAWNIVNLVRMFCDKFEVIIPSKAHSAATLISIGADKIIMTKQATLGPIDPSVNGPFNPSINNMGQIIPLSVSVEDVAGFLELASNEIKNPDRTTLAFQSLVQNVHPLALGMVSRSRGQIKKLAEKLLKNHMGDDSKRGKVISFLCSESGSHDYTINRREAEKDLGLPIEKPTVELYHVLKEIYVDFANELKLRELYHPPTIFGNSDAPVSYTVVRALLESVDGGSDQVQTSGTISLVQNMQQPGQAIMPGIQFFDQRTKEGWVHVNG